MTKFENRVALVTGRGVALNKSMKELYEIAGRSGSKISTVADTYGRIGLAVQGAGRSSTELLLITEAINKSAQISGASASTAAASIMQLSQGLGAGALRGEELNSVMEGIPDLARRIAEGMGIPFSRLRELAKEGGLDTTSVLDAILSQVEDIDDTFSTLKFTVGDLTSVMANEWGRMLANIDAVLGISERAKENIIALAQVFRFVGDNIKLWSLKAQREFLEFQLSVVVTAITVETAIKQMFDFDLGSSRLITALNGTIATLTKFGKDVVGIFKSMFMDIFGNSWWWDMWDEGDEYINSPRLKAALDKATATISDFGTAIKAVFMSMKKDIQPYINDLHDIFRFKTVATPAGDKQVDRLQVMLDDIERMYAFGAKKIKPYADKIAGMITNSELQSKRTVSSISSTCDKIASIQGGSI